MTPVADFCFYWQRAFQTGGRSALVSAIAQVHAAGAIVLVSTGGETEMPYGDDPTVYGTTAGSWAKTYLMCGVQAGDNYLLTRSRLPRFVFRDGVDFDLERIYPGFLYTSSSGALVNWIVTATSAAQAVLGPSKCGSIITHAPQVRTLIFARACTSDMHRLWVLAGNIF